MKKIYRILLVLALSFVGFLSISPDKVHAGIYTSPGLHPGHSNDDYSGNFYTNARVRLMWYYGNGNRSLYLPAGLMYYVTGQYVVFDRNLRGRWAYLGYPNGDITWTGNWSMVNSTRFISWPIIDKFRSRGYMRSINSKTLAGDYVSYIRQNGGDVNQPNAYWYAGKRVDSVDIQAHPINVPAYDHDEVRYSVEGLSGSKSHDYDNSWRGAEWNYYNSRWDSPYDGQSKDGEFNYNHTLTVKVYKIYKHDHRNGYTYMSDQPNPGARTTTTYRQDGPWVHRITFNYNVSSPLPTVYSFKPHNLNKSTGSENGVMLSPNDTALIRRYMNEYTGNDGIMDVTPNNNQNVIDGSDLKSLDTNTPVDFNVRWNNNQYGLPTNKLTLINGPEPNNGWNFTPSNTGSWNAHGDFNQDDTHIGGSKSNTQYYGGTLSAGINSNKASLTYNNGSEQVGPNALTISRPKAGQNDSFKFRAIQEGVYNLFNGKVPFMMVNYNAGIKYTYGFKYSGTVDVNGFHHPSSVSSGMYTGNGTQVVRQPILWGEYKANTVAGDNH